MLKRLRGNFIQTFKISDLKIIHNLELNKTPKWDSLGHLRLMCY